MPTPSPSGPSADSLFAAWLARHESGEESDFDALCREHPSDASRLRELHAQWGSFRGILAQAGLGGTLREKLESQYGGGVDPRVTLEGEEKNKADFSSEVLDRLAGRGPACKRYRLQGEIAHGGMGAILRAWDEDLRRHLAMKVILGQVREEPAGNTPPIDRNVLARFLEEAQVTGQLEHPGIVPVHELGLDGEGRVYFTMKLVEGRHFGEVLELAREGGDGWTQTRALGVIQKVCDAMAYAHSRGVVHRDLKPANVMVGRFGEVYVMDWGLARILAQDQGGPARVESEREAARELDPTSSLHTLQGAVMGTPAYMPPEQALGRIDEIGPASDVYAVGAMIYHLLAGNPPYVKPGSAPTHLEIWQRVKTGPPAELITEARTVPAELVAICERAMAREARSRYPDMAALAADLSAYVEGRVVRAYETGAWAEARKWIQRNRPLAASLAAAAVLLVAGLVVSLTQKARADSKTVEAQTNLTLALKNERDAKDNLTLAQRNEAEAKVQQKRAEAETAKVLRLSDVKVLQELVAEADKLWPAHPDKIPALESWLHRARALAANLPGHRATLAEMRGRAHPWSDEERARDRETHPRAGELAEKQAELDGLIAQLDQGLEGEALATADKRVAELEPEIAALRAEVESRGTWSFDAPEDQWQHDVLAELIRNLQELESGLLAEDAITADHGWSVPKRANFAGTIEERSVGGVEAKRRWSEAIAAVNTSPQYGGLQLKPQLGLLPIGADRESGLQEFWHLSSGDEPQRGEAGELVLTESMGVVLVLIPGGKFWMGAQKDDPAGQNFDPMAAVIEGPVRQVELSPYFLSKYEMTQGQWQSIAGRNPSNYAAGMLIAKHLTTNLHPVEEVSWDDAMEVLSRLGLELPTEAQWERGARGGTDSPWSTGRERETLRGAANLADHSAAATGATWGDIDDWPELDDGWATHAPVGSFRPNAFGLHDVHGNVTEWCRDGYELGTIVQVSAKDPFVEPSEGGFRVCRNGSFGYSAWFARSAARGPYLHDTRANTLGLRPAKRINP